MGHMTKSYLLKSLHIGICGDKYLRLGDLTSAALDLGVANVLSFALRSISSK